MGFWKNLLKWTRVGADVATAAGVKVKGVPVGTIRDAAEKEGKHIADAVKGMKPKPQGDTAE